MKIGIKDLSCPPLLYKAKNILYEGAYMERLGPVAFMIWWLKSEGFFGS